MGRVHLDAVVPAEVPDQVANRLGHMLVHALGHRVAKLLRGLGYMLGDATRHATEQGLKRV
jgi:hypothetical protein